MNEQQAYLILNALPGMGNRRIRALVERSGSAVAALRVSVGQWPQLLNFPSKQLAQVRCFDRAAFLEEELRLIAAGGVQVLTQADPRYPPLLRSIPDAPVVLYVLGQCEVLAQPALALVGSRRASMYGLNTAAKFAADLASMGISIVSGMARGIDTAAHQGCLRAGQKTVAVLGCGLQHIYPPENERLMKQISDQGAVVSEFPMNALPKAMHFPRRNRVVSGLSLGVLVVEAAAKSGALITADFALEQGREVFAIPGPIDRPSAAGGLALLKQGAKLVTGVEDIIEELAPQLVTAWAGATPESVKPQIKQESSQDKTPAAVIRSSLSLDEEKILKCLDRLPRSLDEVSLRCGQPVNRIASVLLDLEFKHCIRSLPGRRYIREKAKGKSEKNRNES